MSFVQNTAPPLAGEKLALSPSLQRPRFDAVDLLRGLVMIIMALDHMRYPYFTNSTIWPEDITQTYAALFFTRWITHFCAPLFFLLAGTGSYLSFAPGKTIKAISRFFWTRGLWLGLLEITIIDYFMTLFVVTLLYFPCAWFAGLKRRRKDCWLRYI